MAAKNILYTGEFLTLTRDGHWEYVSRHQCRGAVMIFALTEKQEVILLEQYRIPMQGPVIEFPAGLVGDEGVPDESWTNAAQRELAEETGYSASDLLPVCVGASSPGMSDELVHCFIARGLTRIGEGGGNDDEQIIVHHVPLDEIDAWLTQKAHRGAFIDPKVYTGLYWLTHPRYK